MRKAEAAKVLKIERRNPAEWAEFKLPITPVADKTSVPFTWRERAGDITIRRGIDALDNGQIKPKHAAREPSCCRTYIFVFFFF